MIEKDLDDALKEGVYAKRPILKAIKLKCMDCCCGKTCFLHPFRLGKNPFTKKEYTEEQRAEMREKFMQRLGRK